MSTINNSSSLDKAEKLDISEKVVNKEVIGKNDRYDQVNKKNNNIDQSIIDGGANSDFSQVFINVKNLIIFTKLDDDNTFLSTIKLVKWILAQKKNIVVHVDTKIKNRVSALNTLQSEIGIHLRFWKKKFVTKNAQIFDLVVTLGGDGTLLYVSTLFQNFVPPVISFSFGSLGFLTNFSFKNFEHQMKAVLEQSSTIIKRMRFCLLVYKASGALVSLYVLLNEVILDRGLNPYVTQLELYADNNLLTVALADGLIVSTPTGSTAYSLSAGGSIVHPSVRTICLTPICPHTLSFRPILLPENVLLKIKVSNQSRSSAWISIDGKKRAELFVGDYIELASYPFFFPTIVYKKNDFFDSVCRKLNWNDRSYELPPTN